MDQAEADALLQKTLNTFSKNFVSGHVFATPNMVVLTLRVSETLDMNKPARSFAEYMMDAEQWVFDYWHHLLAETQVMKTYWDFDIE